MAIPREKKKELRAKALSIVWKALDAAMRMDLDPDCKLSSEEVLFIEKIIDQKAQKAFCDFTDYENRKAKQ